MAFVAVKTLNGFNYIQASHVVAVQTSPTGGSVLVLATGTLIPSIESSKEVVQRLDAAAPGPPPNDVSTTKAED